MADLALTNPTGAIERVDARRSTRVFQVLPLSISGMNELGNPFLELTSAVAFNCHGCLYRSRHHNPPGAWVTMHMANTATGKAQPVRAQIRFVRVPASPKELYQVGVELEKPANVWGIQAPPEDWMSFTGTVAQGAAMERNSGLRVVSASESSGQGGSDNGVPAIADRRHPTESTELAGAPLAGKPARVVVSSEQLLQRLEGRVQQAVEKAVDAAMSTRFSAAVNQAAKAIDEFSQASVRKVQKQYEQYREQMVISAREQFLSRVQEDIASAEERLERRVEALLGRAEEAGRRWEESVAKVEPALVEAENILQKAALRAQYEFAARAGEVASQVQAEFGDRAGALGEQQIARLNEQAQSTVNAVAKELQTKTDDTRTQLIGAAGTALAELQVAAKSEIERAVGESRQNVQSSLASFCEEANADWENRLRACQDDLANSSAQGVEEFRLRLQSILNSSMIAATSAVSEHAQALLNALTKDAGQSLQESVHEPSSS